MGRFLIGDRNHLTQLSEFSGFSPGNQLVCSLYLSWVCFVFGGDLGDLPFKIEQSKNSFPRSVSLYLTSTQAPF